jgi:hypothetical protein
MMSLQGAFQKLLKCEGMWACLVLFEKECQGLHWNAEQWPHKEACTKMRGNIGPLGGFLLPNKTDLIKAGLDENGMVLIEKK